MNKTILALFGVMLFGAGLVMAGSALGATKSQNNTDARWAGNTADSLKVGGGNITYVDISGTMLTGNWAAFHGLTTGTVVLQDNNSNQVYSWNWNPANGGIVCVTENGGSSILDLATATGDEAAVDSAYSIMSGPDNVVTTFNTTENLPFVEGAVSTDATQDLAGWKTALVSVPAGSGKGLYAFCQNINASGVAYDTTPANYEVMVPTTPGITPETYDFYMQLN